MRRQRQRQRLPAAGTRAAALLLLLIAATPAAGGGGRRLAQGVVPAAVPAAAAAAVAANGSPSPATEHSQYGSPNVDMCIQLTSSAGEACTVESDTLSLVYPRGSEQLPTPQEVSEAITNMKAAAQPSQSCCNDFKPYVDARCPCDPGYQQILPIGGFDPAYFEGATAILAEACGFDFPPCRAGEMAEPGGR